MPTGSTFAERRYKEIRAQFDFGAARGGVVRANLAPGGDEKYECSYGEVSLRGVLSTSILTGALPSLRVMPISRAALFERSM